MPRALKIHLVGTPEEIDFVIRAIVSEGFSPNPKTEWRGRQQIIALAKKEFGATASAAADLVDLSVVKLWDEKSEISVPAERRMMIMRLKQLRQLIYDQLKGRKKTINFDLKARKNGEKIVKRAGKTVYDRILTGGKTSTQINPALSRLLIEIEDRLVNLLGIDDVGAGGDLKRRLIDEMDAAHKREGLPMPVFSSPPRGLPEPAKKIIAAIIEPEKKPMVEQAPVKEPAIEVLVNNEELKPAAKPTDPRPPADGERTIDSFEA